MINFKEIVLLDDNNDTNFYNQDVVEEINIFDTISVFESPVKLLKEIENRLQQKVDIPGYFIVDIKMPEMEGFEFLDELEMIIEDFEEFPHIFILTTSNHKRDQEQFKKSFLAKSYLTKPLMPETLKKEIESM